MSEPVAPLAPAPEEMPPEAVAPEAAPCLNCGADRLGDYCHACGQHHLDDRLTLRVVWREFAERFLKLERGLLGTTRAALVDPGALARRYVEGQRKRFVNPISFLLLASAVAVLMLPLYASTDRMLNDPMLAAQSDSTRLATSMELGFELGGGDWDAVPEAERAELIAEAVERQERFLPAYISTVQQLYSVFSVALAVAFAALYKLFFSGRDRTFTFAETLILGCYLTGIYVLLSALFASAMTPFAPVIAGTIVTTFLAVGLGALGARGFYERTAGAAALGGLTGLVALAVYLVVVVVVAIPIVIVKML